MVAHCPEENYKLLEGKMPSHLTGSIQYGRIVIALVIVLLTIGYVSIERTREIVHGLTGYRISTGTISNMKSRFAAQSKAANMEIVEYMKAQNYIYADETGCRVNGKMNWIHVACNNKWTALSLQPKRGMEGFEGAGILPNLPKGACLMTDFWPSYLKLDLENHCFCLQHLQREALRIYEITGEDWALLYKKYFALMIHARNQCFDAGLSCLPNDVLSAFDEYYDKLLNIGFSLHPEPKQEGTRRVKRSVALNYLIRLRDYKGSILFPFRNFSIDPTNNVAEQAVRFAGRMDRINGGFRSFTGGSEHIDIMSYISTAKKHGMTAMDAIKVAFDDGALDLIRQFEKMDAISTTPVA